MAIVKLTLKDGTVLHCDDEGYAKQEDKIACLHDGVVEVYVLKWTSLKSSPNGWMKVIAEEPPIGPQPKIIFNGLIRLKDGTLVFYEEAEIRIGEEVVNLRYGQVFKAKSNYTKGTPVCKVIKIVPPEQPYI